MKQLSFFDIEKKPLPEKKTVKVTLWKLYIDGASRNNPGKAGAGIVIYKNGKFHEKRGFSIGTKTNNQAEYYALLLGLFIVRHYIHDSDMLSIISDSQLLIKQFKGEYKIKHPELKPLHIVAQQLLPQKNYEFIHVMREENSEADAMANYGIDHHIKVPLEFITLLERYGIIF